MWLEIKAWFPQSIIDEGTDAFNAHALEWFTIALNTSESIIAGTAESGAMLGATVMYTPPPRRPGPRPPRAVDGSCYRRWTRTESP